MTEPLQRILGSAEPLTLAGVPIGFLPWLAADIARAAHGRSKPGRAVVIAADELAMRALADTVPVFAPEVEVLTLPAWDCLPYDRASPALRAMAERLATLHSLQQPLKKPQLVIATANSATQRVLTPFRIRQLTRRIAEGERIERDALATQLTALGYQRTDSVAEQGEYAVRGSLIDLFPPGERQALRLDFFGDEIETLRRFDPADQRSTGAAEAFMLMPASEALLDEGSIKRFRERYREMFGATATGDPLYQAVSDGRRLAGMEHWLPLFEEKLATGFDYLGENDIVLRDAGVDGALDGRFESLDDYYQNRVRAMQSEPAAIVRCRPTRFTSPATSGAAHWRTSGSIAARLSRKPKAPKPSISASSPRAISRRSGRAMRMSMKLWRTMCRRFAAAATRSSWQATLPVHGSGSLESWKIMD